MNAIAIENKLTLILVKNVAYSDSLPPVRWTTVRVR